MGGYYIGQNFGAVAVQGGIAEIARDPAEVAAADMRQYPLQRVAQGRGYPAAVLKIGVDHRAAVFAAQHYPAIGQCMEAGQAIRLTRELLDRAFPSQKKPLSRLTG